MNYYSHHIGDFNSATRHLTRLERSIYRDLIDLYYDKEKPLASDIDRLARVIIARSKDEIEALKCVLNEFFILDNDFYHHERCDYEIEIYKRKADTARANGRKGGRPRNQEITQLVNLENQEESESKANQEPRTKNQELKKEKECSEQTSVCTKPALVSILLKSGKTADFNIDQITETAKSFPRLSVDVVRNELLKCALWNKDNPKRRKTEAGIGRHISSWLSRFDENSSGKAQTNEAAQAWLNVIDQISAVGRAGNPNMDDKARNAVEKLFGGWMNLCSRTTKDLDFARAKFINLYNGG